MKAHKYWSLGALACMTGCFYTGCKKLMKAHKYFAYGALGCMGMLPSFPTMSNTFRSSVVMDITSEFCT